MSSEKVFTETLLRNSRLLTSLNSLPSSAVKDSRLEECPHEHAFFNPWNQNPQYVEERKSEEKTTTNEKTTLSYNRIKVEKINSSLYNAFSSYSPQNLKNNGDIIND